ncbi:MAG TPA: FixH family protein [Caulobacteraceae bacterium]|nr:FixH family protein [Caulobacteraceae bacterium]
MSLSDRPEGFRLNGLHVLGLFVLFFGVIAAVNINFIVHAYGTYPGEVSTTPYEDGLAYNKVLQQGDAQAALGWRAAMGFKAQGLVELTMTDHDGRPVVLSRIDAAIERPATLNGRRVLRFAAVSPGVYVAKTDAPSGAWDLTLTADDGRGHRFDGARRIIAP